MAGQLLVWKFSHMNHINTLIDTITKAMAYSRKKPEKIMRQLIAEWYNVYADDMMQYVYTNQHVLFGTEKCYAKGSANKEELMLVAVTAAVEALREGDLLSAAIVKGKRKAQKFNRECAKTVQMYE